MKDVKRSYAMSDDSMLGEANTIFALAQNDFGELSAVEPELTRDQLTTWQNEAKECSSDFSSLGSKSAISLETKRVNDAMDVCKGKTSLFYYHLDRALIDIPNIEVLFGRRGFDDARKNPEKMVRQINLIVTTGKKPEYMAKLTKRLGDNFFTELTDLQANLQAALAAQNLAKANQPAETEARVLRYNAIWNNIRFINEVAKIAFYGRPAKLQQYQLYDSPAPKKPENPDENKNDMPDDI